VTYARLGSGYILPSVGLKKVHVGNAVQFEGYLILNPILESGERGQVSVSLVEDTLVEDTLVEDTLVEDTLVEDTLVEDNAVVLSRICGSAPVYVFLGCKMLLYKIINNKLDNIKSAKSKKALFLLVLSSFSSFMAC
jgi:hypothetical protein